MVDARLTGITLTGWPSVPAVMIYPVIVSKDASFGACQDSRIEDGELDTMLSELSGALLPCPVESFHASGGGSSPAGEK